MMLFITSVRHPRNCNDYGRVSKLLESTLRTVLRQTSDEYEIIVVCNKLPSINVDHPKVHFHVVDFPPPSTVSGPKTGREAVLLDRGSKYAAALLYAKQFNPHHIMFFDADDYLSNRIAEFVNTHKDSHGWYMPKGFVYIANQKYIYTHDDFHRFNGSSLIFSFSTFTIPGNLSAFARIEELIDGFGLDYIKKMLGSHISPYDILQHSSKPLERLPFRGAIYLLATGENHSGVVEYEGPGRKLLSKKIRIEFGLSAPRVEGIIGKLQKLMFNHHDEEFCV